MQVFWCLINFALLFYNFQYCMYYSLLKFDKENFIKKHDNRKNPKIQTNTQNPLKTSLFNLVWSYRVVIDPLSISKTRALWNWRCRIVNYLMTCTIVLQVPMYLGETTFLCIFSCGLVGENYRWQRHNRKQKMFPKEKERENCPTLYLACGLIPFIYISSEPFIGQRQIGKLQHQIEGK